MWFATFLSLHRGYAFNSRGLLGIIDAQLAGIGVISGYHDVLVRLPVFVKCCVFELVATESQ